jgi:hypothetical protein
LRLDEVVEIGVGEHLAGALEAVADLDITKCARVDMTLERLHRAAELVSGFG